MRDGILVLIAHRENVAASLDRGRVDRGEHRQEGAAATPVLHAGRRRAGPDHGLWDEWRDKQSGEMIRSATMIIAEPSHERPSVSAAGSGSSGRNSA